MRTRLLAAIAAAALAAGGCGGSGGAPGGAARAGGGKQQAGDTASAQAAAGDTAGDEDEAGDTHHRWQVKTSLAPGADPAQPRTVALEDLLALPDAPGVGKSDRRYQTARIPEPIGRLGLREGQMVRTSGWLHLVAHPADDDYHLQLTTSPASGDGCLIVEIPAKDKVGDAGLARLAGEARKWVRDQVLQGDKPDKKGTELPQPVHVFVTGALFYDDAHVGEPPRGKRGTHASTLWEIHPVVDIGMADAPK